MDWYVLFVTSGKEELVKKWLDYHFDIKEFYSVIPKKKTKRKKQGKIKYIFRAIFPGYIFIRTEMNIAKYKIIKRIPNLIKVLNTGAYYSKVAENEMATILKLISDDDFINLSSIFIENSKVFVKAGPLLGMEGSIVKVDKHKRRAKILLNFLGTPRTIDVGIELIGSFK